VREGGARGYNAVVDVVPGSIACQPCYLILFARHDVFDVIAMVMDPNTANDLLT